jgi:hypothetical protein
MAKSRPYLAGAGLAVVLVAAVVVPWLVDRWAGQDPAPTPPIPRKDPPPGPRALRDPPDELALPVPTAGEPERVILQIHLSEGDGWRLNLGANGTAQFGYGAADFWPVKPKTFDFAATLQALRTVTYKQVSWRGLHYRVSFVPERGENPISGYTRDDKLVRGLFEKAVEGLQHRDARFEQLWKEVPLFRIEGK